jgi:hypothetical protein
MEQQILITMLIPDYVDKFTLFFAQNFALKTKINLVNNLLCVNIETNFPTTKICEMIAKYCLEHQLFIHSAIVIGPANHGWETSFAPSNIKFSKTPPNKPKQKLPSLTNLKKKSSHLILVKNSNE